MRISLDSNTISKSNSYLIGLSPTWDFNLFQNVPGLTLLLASWLSWQDLAKFLLHLGSHGSHGKILIKILQDNTYSKIVSYHDGQNFKIIKNTIPLVQEAETQSKGSFQPTTTISTRFHNQNA